MTAIVTFGGLTMYGDNQHADGVYQVGKRFFSDWYSTSDSKVEARERPVSDGAFGIDQDWRTSLPLQMNGRFRGASWLAMMNALRVAVSTGSMVPVSVTDDEGTTSREVSIRRFKPYPDPGSKTCSFDIDMLALDPNRYGPEQTVTTGLGTPGAGAPWPADWDPGYDWGSGGDPGRVSATNTGTATTYPRLEALGGLSGGTELVEIVTGSTLRLERDIPVTSTVFFDTRTGRAYLDIPSNDISGFLTRREWSGFAMPAGATRTVQFNALGGTSGTPLLTLRYSPAH